MVRRGGWAVDGLAWGHTVCCGAADLFRACDCVSCVLFCDDAGCCVGVWFAVGVAVFGFFGDEPVSLRLDSLGTFCMIALPETEGNDTR